MKKAIIVSLFVLGFVVSPALAQEADKCQVVQDDEDGVRLICPEGVKPEGYANCTSDDDVLYLCKQADDPDAKRADDQAEDKPDDANEVSKCDVVQEDENEVMLNCPEGVKPKGYASCTDIDGVMYRCNKKPATEADDPDAKKPDDQAEDKPDDAEVSDGEEEVNLEDFLLELRKNMIRPPNTEESAAILCRQELKGDDPLWNKCDALAKRLWKEKKASKKASADAIADEKAKPFAPGAFHRDLMQKMGRADTIALAVGICRKDLSGKPRIVKCGELAKWIWETNAKLKADHDAEALARARKLRAGKACDKDSFHEKLLHSDVLRKAADHYLATRYGLRDADFERKIIEAETEPTNYAMGIISVGGSGGKVSRATMLFSYVDWIGERLNYHARFTTGFSPDHGAIPHLTLGGGLGLGARDKFFVTPYLDLGIFFHKKTDPDFLMQYGVEVGFFVGLITSFFIDEEGWWDRIGLVFDFGYAYLPLNSESSPGFEFRGGIAFPF